MAFLRDFESAHSSMRAARAAVVSSRARHRAAQTRARAQNMKSQR
jgi:hypothetical protein